MSKNFITFLSDKFKDKENLKEQAIVVIALAPFLLLVGIVHIFDLSLGFMFLYIPIAVIEMLLATYYWDYKPNQEIEKDNKHKDFKK